MRNSLKVFAAALLLVTLTVNASAVRAQSFSSGSAGWFDGFDDWLSDLGDIKVEDFQFSLGAGVGLAPDFPGGNEYKAVALPFFQIRYKDTLTVDPLGLRLRVWKNDCCRLRLFAGLAESRHASKGTPVDALPNVGRGMNEIGRASC